MFVALSVEPAVAMATPFVEDNDDLSVQLLEAEEESRERSLEEFDSFLEGLTKTHKTKLDSGFQHFFTPSYCCNNWVLNIAPHSIGKIHTKEARVLTEIPSRPLYVLFHHFKLDSYTIFS